MSAASRPVCVALHEGMQDYHVWGVPDWGMQTATPFSFGQMDDTYTQLAEATPLAPLGVSPPMTILCKPILPKERGGLILLGASSLQDLSH